MSRSQFSEWERDPFAFLGPHAGEVRTYQPGALGVEVVNATTGRRIATLSDTGAGLFIGKPRGQGKYRLRIQWPDESQETEDPYAFGPLLSDEVLASFAAGAAWDLAEHFGAIPRTVDGVAGVSFALWAPNARRVALVGDFNNWDGRRNPMRLRHAAGVWEIFIPRLTCGARYKYEVVGADGVTRQRADPVARETEIPPANASVVSAPLEYGWGDASWMASRGERHHRGAPISIYELHAASWRRPWGGRPCHDWDELGEQLIDYVAALGFTHVELLPIMEHPFGGSWGYQPLSQFAPSARYGEPAAFARFVDRCHQAGLGVILDWVPGHFPDDVHGLAQFDGTALYEHVDPQEGFHPDWNTLIYNLGRTEVAGFLIASAVWWLEQFHVDGLRVDAVASMLYRDYSRKPGEWTPNVHGGRENLEAIAFLRRFNTVVAQRCPGVITLAEESTAWPGVTAPPDAGGLGFSYKWNMGWMNDTLRYMARDPVHRGWHGGDIGFGLTYAFSEAFVLPLSHDEVVHGKRSLLAKMPGDPWRQFADLRLLFALMWAHPGKKLLFMGGELGAWSEWDHDGELHWPLLELPEHAGVHRLVADLNALYAAEGALHHTDADPRGFEWIAENPGGQSVFVFLRRSFHGGAPIIFAANMTPQPLADWVIEAPVSGRWRVAINTDDPGYGGSGLVTAREFTSTLANQIQRLTLDLPPLGAVFLRYEGSDL